VTVDGVGGHNLGGLSIFENHIYRGFKLADQRRGVGPGDLNFFGLSTGIGREGGALKYHIEMIALVIGGP